jgi:hypothetical protein
MLVIAAWWCYIRIIRKQQIRLKPRTVEDGVSVCPGMFFTHRNADIILSSIFLATRVSGQYRFVTMYFI